MMRSIFLRFVSFVLAAILASPANASCPTYTASGPITVTQNNQIIQGLVITSTSGPGVLINGYSGTLINNVVIKHAGGHGVSATNAPNTTIVNADIVDTGAPASGADATINENDIDCESSANIVVANVRLTRGSSHIYLNGCSGSNLAGIEGHDVRGPFPRGQLVQWNASPNGTLDNFSSENLVATSFTEDLVSVYETAHVVISHGLISGQTSTAGDGLNADVGSSYVQVSNVDAVGQANGCFAAYGGSEHDITFTGTRCGSTVCSLPNGAPLSGSLAWAVDPTSTGNISILSSTYSNLCNPTNLVFDGTKVATFQATQAAFVPRPPLRVALCQYAY